MQRVGKTLLSTMQESETLKVDSINILKYLHSKKYWKSKCNNKLKANNYQTYEKLSCSRQVMFFAQHLYQYHNFAWWIILALWLCWAPPPLRPKRGGGAHVIYLVTGSSQSLAHDLFGASKKERMTRTSVQATGKKDSSTEFGGMKL